MLSALILATSCCCTAHAQYVGKVNTNQTQAPTLRATAVLEYTGDLAKPNASRLIPVAVWDGDHYQPGGLYLAQPVPLTVESGTQYILEQAGTPKGFYDVKGAADMQGKWIGVGGYEKPTPPNFAKLHRMHNLPLIADDSKPHFAHVPSGDTKEGATTAASQNNASAVDPDRPTLHQRSSGEGTQGSSGAPNPTAPADPDRPILHEQSRSNTSSSAADNANQSPETALAAPDPNRPILEYGKPEQEEALDSPSKQIDKLSGKPIGLKQMVAVSDAVNRPQHSYVYSWSSPEDEAKMQSAVASIAQQLLAASAPKPAQPAPSQVRRRRAVVRKPSEPVLPVLGDVQFNAYELAYGAGATYILSATTGEGEQARYITLIAQPDFNGTPVVLFKQITSERDLSVIPKMELIDAADTDGDNRAELIFALENASSRQYAIYRVADGRAEQVFTTGNEPLAP